MKTLGLILCYGVIHAAANWWYENTETGRVVKHYLVNWKTDWVFGVGLAFTIVVGAMVAAIYTMKWKLGYL